MCARSFALTSLVLVLSACDGGLELSIDLRSDRVAGVEVDQAEVVWQRAGQELGREVVPLGAGTDLVAGIRLVDAASLSPGAYRVRVTLRRAGRDVAERSRTFQMSGDFAVLMVLTRACGDDGCEPARCDTAAQCVRERACFRPECLGGVCLAVPDDSLCAAGRCDPERGCGPGGDVDAGPGGPGDDAGRSDAGLGDAGPGCGTLDCSDPACAGRPCDDANLCTHGDVCGGGVCRGTSISCSDSPCVTRVCDGTASCAETPRSNGVACTDDGNACTADVCRTGRCEHDPRPDGYGLGGFRMCCGGADVDTATNRSHCGGCGLACSGSLPCTMHTGHPTCDCTSNTHCQGGTNWLCSSVWDFVCACTSDSGCPGSSTCINRDGPDYCEY